MTVSGKKSTISYVLETFGSLPVPVERAIPRPEGGEVLLRVLNAGVCHSDVHILDGYHDLGDGNRFDYRTYQTLPLTLGHEVAGEVVAVGKDGDQSLIGTKKLVYPWIGCGQCLSCRMGKENHCPDIRAIGILRDGGYGEHVLVPDASYLIDIDRIDPAWACTLACSGVTTYSALRQLGPIVAGGAVAIIGAGGLGLMAIAIARALGIERIIACDITDDHLAAARNLGADDIVNTALPDAEQRLGTAGNGRIFGVVDTVGIPATVRLGMASLMRGGKLVLVGLQGGKIELPLPPIAFRAISLTGTQTGSLDELKELVAIAKSGALAPLPLEIRPMRRLGETLEALRSGAVKGRVVLDPSAD